MTFFNKKIACFTFDATCLLRIDLESPVDDGESSQIVFKYLSEYISGCECFANGKLFAELESDYKKNHALSHTKYMPYNYQIRITETYNDGVKSSYLIIAVLTQADKLLDYGVDSVVFIDDSMIPQRILIKKRLSQNEVVVLDSNGTAVIKNIRDYI